MSSNLKLTLINKTTFETLYTHPCLLPTYTHLRSLLNPCPPSVTWKSPFTVSSGSLSRVTSVSKYSWKPKFSLLDVIDEQSLDVHATFTLKGTVSSCPFTNVSCGGSSSKVISASISAIKTLNERKCACYFSYV